MWNCVRVIKSHPNLLVYFGDIMINIIVINCSWVIAVHYKVYCTQYFIVRWSTIVMWATVNSEFCMDHSTICAMLGRDYFVDKYFKLSPTYNSFTLSAGKTYWPLGLPGNYYVPTVLKLKNLYFYPQSCLFRVLLTLDISISQNVIFLFDVRVEVLILLLSFLHFVDRASCYDSS